jgi:hypothetical protein
MENANVFIPLRPAIPSRTVPAVLVIPSEKWAITHNHSDSCKTSQTVILSEGEQPYRSPQSKNLLYVRSAHPVFILGGEPPITASCFTPTELTRLALSVTTSNRGGLLYARCTPPFSTSAVTPYQGCLVVSCYPFQPDDQKQMLLGRRGLLPGSH